MATVDSTMLPRIAVVFITVCSLFNGSLSLQQSACEIEMTEKRFMTCNGEKLHNTVNPPSDLPWDSSVPPYTILLEPLYLSTIPQGGQYSANSDVYLSCVVSCYNEGKEGSDCPEINWAFANESSITANDKYVINDTMLTITGFDSVDEGEYICYIDYGSFSISSYPVSLALPKFTNWSMVVYDDPNEIQDEQTIDMTISPYDVAILECTVEDADPAPSVVWSPKANGHNLILLPSGNLLVKNLEKTTTFSCFNLIEGASSQPKLLIYNVNVVPKDQQGEPVLVASPRSQTVIFGSKVTLYCLFHSNSTVEYTWYRNGQPLSTNGTLPYVMVINNVMESGSYECMGSNQYGNASGIAEITVLDIPYPAITVLSSSVKYRTDHIDIALADVTGPVSLLLNCTLMEPLVTQFRWLYKGHHVTGSAHQLHVNGSSIDEIIGSVQCFTDVLGTTGIGYSRVVKDKSNPPLNVEMDPSSNSPSVTIAWDPPTGTISYKYILEVQTDDGISQMETTTTCIRVNMKVETYGVGCDLTVHARIQAIPSVHLTRYSDYFYMESGKVDCYAPRPAVLTNQKSVLTGLTGREFNYILYFDNVSTSFANIPEFTGVFNECDDMLFNDGGYTAFYCCAFSNEGECTLLNDDDHEILVVEYNKTTINPECHQKCFWWAGVHASDLNPAHMNSFITPDLPPAANGSITNIDWIGNKGTQIQLTIELPAMELSCFPTSLSIHCGVDHEEMELDLRNLTMVFNRSPDSCWDPCSLYFTYNNSVGMSPPSTGIRLPTPSKGNIEGFYNLAYRISEVITIEWALADGMECLLQKRYISRVVFYFAKGGNGIDCLRIFEWSDPYRLANLTATSLVLNDTYLFNGGEVCVRIGFALTNGSNDLDSGKYTYTTMKHIPVHTSHSSRLPEPTTTPLTPPTSASNNYDQISTQLFLTTSLPTIGIVMILIFFILAVVCFVYKRTKRRHGQSYDRQQLMPDGSDILSLGPKDDETGTVITKYEDLEHVKQERMECYLNDVEEFSNGGESKDDQETNESHSSPNSLEHVKVVVELNDPMERSQDRVGKKMKKRDRSVKNTKTMAPQDNSDIPSVTLLKDCETVQNACHDVSKLLNDDYIRPPQEYPAVVAATGLNQSMGGVPIHMDGHELQEIANNHERDNYEDMTTPIINTTTPIIDMTTPTENQDKSLAQHQTLPSSLNIINFDQIASPTKQRPDSLPLIPLPTPLTSPQYNITRSSHMSSSHMTGSHMISRQPEFDFHHQHTAVRNPSLAAVNGSNEHHPTRVSSTCNSDSSYLDNPFTNHSLHLSLPPLLARPSPLTPIAVNTTTTQSMDTRTRQTSSRSSQTGYEMVCDREEQPAQLPYFPMSPSRVSSGIGSPKSSGSVESVFDYQLDGSSKDMGKQSFRHRSDATSGINSPGILSPAQVKTGAYFSTLPPPLSMGGVSGYLGGANESVGEINRPTDERISKNTFSTSSEGAQGWDQQRRTSLDQYLPHPSLNSTQSFTQQPNLRSSIPLTQPRPLISSGYLPHTPVTSSSNMPHPRTPSSSSYVSHPQIITSSTISRPSSGHVTPLTPLVSQPFNISRHTSPCTPSPCQPYVVPSLLPSAQNMSSNTLPVAMETPTVPDRAHSNSSASDDFSESYSIGSDPSSMEDFKQKKSNDYIITDDDSSSL